MRRKTKSPEISRLIDFMRSKNMKTTDLAASIAMPERTLNNAIWNNTPLGGRLLRKLLSVHGLSIDWLVAGHGDRYVNETERDELPVDNDTVSDPLIPYYETANFNHFTDYWWLVARATEQSLIQSGAVPGQDYSVMDCYELSRPFVLERLRSAGLDITTPEKF